VGLLYDMLTHPNIRGATRIVAGITRWFGLSALLFLASATAEPLRTIRVAEKAEIRAIALSPETNTLALSVYALLPGGDIETAIEVWHDGEQTPRAKLRQKPWWVDSERNSGMYVVGSLEFSPDGKSIVATDGHGFVLWDINTFAERFRWGSGGVEPTLSPGWSSDGKWLALPSMEEDKFAFTNGVALVETSSGRRMAFFPIESGYARTARFSPDARLVATVGNDACVRVFDVQKRTSIFQDIQAAKMFAAAFSPNGRQLAVGPRSGGVILLYDVSWDDQRAVIKKTGTTSETREEIHSIQFTPDGARIITTSHVGLRLWTGDWSRSEVIRACMGQLSSDGKRLGIVREKAKNVLEVWSLHDFAAALSKER
jgi:WD40 repeat protein